MTAPRGIRNNNPGNIIRSGISWTGEKASIDETHFEVFDTPEHGIQALCKLLLSYQERHGLNTVRGIINRWAPPVENDTGAYVAAVASAIGIAADEPLDLHSPSVLLPFAEAIIRHENGMQPYTLAQLTQGVDVALGLRTEASPAAPEQPTQAPAGPAAPLPPKPVTGGAMGALALLQMFGPILSGLIPQISTILKPGSEVAQRNVDLAQVLVETINKAAAHPTLQGSVEAMQADPAVRAAVQQAVVTEPAIMDTLQIGPGDVGGARKAAAETAAAMAADPWQIIIVKTVFNPVLLVTLMVLPIIYMIVHGLLPFLEKVSGDVIAQTIGTVIGLILGGVMGFWTGQTYTQSSQKRATDAAAK